MGTADRKGTTENCVPSLSATVGSSPPLISGENVSDLKTPSEASKGRGGARNRADRLSNTLPLGSVLEHREAASFAWAIGLPLNRFITINFSILGIGDEQVARLTGEFLRHAKQFLASRGGETAYIYTREIAGKQGTHVHILLHLPPHLSDDFKRLQQGWLRRATGLTYKARALHSAWISGSSRSAEHSPPFYRDNLHRLLNYLAKGVSRADSVTLGLTLRVEMPPIIGKRCGTSQNIGVAARAKLGISVQSPFNEQLDKSSIKAPEPVQPVFDVSDLASVESAFVDHCGLRISSHLGAVHMRPQAESKRRFIAVHAGPITFRAGLRGGAGGKSEGDHVASAGLGQTFKKFERGQDRLRIWPTGFRQFSIQPIDNGRKVGTRERIVPYCTRGDPLSLATPPHVYSNVREVSGNTPAVLSHRIRDPPIKCDTHGQVSLSQQTGLFEIEHLISPAICLIRYRYTRLILGHQLIIKGSNWHRKSTGRPIGEWATTSDLL